MIKGIKRLSKARNCPLCRDGVELDYKDVPVLRKFISERGKIMGRARTAICARHQRQVTRSVKIARTMALLPYVQG